MKIAYIAFENFSHEGGVLKKIINQIQAWTNIGNTAKLFVVSSEGKLWKGASVIPYEVILPGDKKSLLRRLDVWKPDIVYVRVPFKVRHLLDVIRKYPTVFEINSNDLIEFKMFKNPSWSQLAKYKIGRKSIFKRAAGLVFVTEELSRIHYGRGKPSEVIPNAAALSDFPVFLAPKNPEPHLVFIGTKGFPWHGVEEIIKLAKQVPDWHFDIVGFDDIDKYREIPSNIKNHGYLDKTSYESILQKADVAFGTLALFEKNMNEACPLKVREYLAYGIPVIIGYKEADFPKGAPFILQLPNKSNNAIDHVDEIKGFVEKWRGKRVPREEIKHLDVSVKERERLEFFHKIIDI